MSKACDYCGKPLKHLRPGATKSEHGWCRGLVAPSPAGNRGVAPARFALSGFADARPITPVEDSTMAKPQKKVVPITEAPPTLDQVVAEGEAYEFLKAEAERIELALSKKADFLRNALPNFPNARVRIGARDLGLVESVSESFDLMAAKKKPSLQPLLVPYIETIEKFDLRAARKHLAEEQLARFITIRKTFSLRFLKPGGVE